MEDLGYEIARRGKQWDLAAIPKSLAAKFSRRIDQIEKLAREQGIDNPDEKSQLGAKTRQKKQQELSMGQLRTAWRDRLTDAERQILSELPKNLKSATRPSAGRDAESQSLDHAILHCYERQSVIPKRKLLAEALRHGMGQVDVEKLKAELAGKPVIVRTVGDQELATTTEVLAEERAMLDYARRGRGQAQPLNAGWHIQREWLNRDQQAAVRHVVESRDKVITIAGKAGVGKTTLMTEACEAIRGGGHDVYAFAPSAEASRGVLQGRRV